MFIVANLQAWLNPPESDHYCYITSGKACRAYIITEGADVATAVCPDSHKGYIYRRIKGGWYQMARRYIQG